MSRHTEADRLLRLIVAARRSCERCHGLNGPGSQVAHIVRRRYTATRWLEDNVWWLCVGCHHAVDNHAAEHDLLVAETIGEGRLGQLLRLADAGPAMSASLWAAQERDRLRRRCRQLDIPLRGAA